MSVKSLFTFITDPTVTEKNMDEYLDEVSKQMENQSIEQDAQQEIEEEVFKQAYIPQRLTQVIFQYNSGTVFIYTLIYKLYILIL